MVGKIVIRWHGEGRTRVVAVADMMVDNKGLGRESGNCDFATG